MRAASAANQFRAVARSTEDETTKLLAEGLTHLADARSGRVERFIGVDAVDEHHHALDSFDDGMPCDE